MSFQKLLTDIIEENNGYLDVSYAKSKGISSSILTTFKRKNNLIKVAHGLYKTEDAWDDELYVVGKSNSKIIFSHETALFLNDLMEREPYDISVTVYVGYNATHLRKQNIRVYQLNKEMHEIGKTVCHTRFNHQVQVYDAERTLCDLVRNKDKVDVQIYSTAWKLYLKRKDRDIPKLMRYSKKFNIEELIRNYLEVIL